ncbi:ATP-binding protein [Kitasatospora sp. NA04385]|uniref:ATP-binding protein n=1 Tax=Kitasatospora sp. NA04385 TaxID=2742135 RepID=UPI001591AF33|nr:ATP-binding protein [Kitasatospora sp. NA04385]QKW21904.1 ATP-binding protein [Kitasatospora sp. NA04385]
MRRKAQRADGGDAPDVRTGHAGGRPARPRCVLLLEDEPRPAALSRALVGEVLAEHYGARRHGAAPGGVGPADEVALLVCELVANAVRHGGGPVEIVLEPGTDRLRIEVADRTALLAPVERPHRPDLPGGHGLRIVAEVADRWGTVPRGAGKAVWIEIDAARLSGPGTAPRPGSVGPDLA